MKIIIDIDEDYSNQAVKEYMDCISIDEEHIRAITFKK